MDTDVIERGDNAPAGPNAASLRRALLLINPNSRRGKEPLDPILRQLADGGLHVAVETFKSPSEVAADIIARKDDVDCVIVCGGDGTMSAAAPGIIETKLPMGILPMGTANDLARTLGIPEDLSKAAEIIVKGKTRGIDLGSVNGHLFFNVASIGLSVELARNLCGETKRRWGRFGYAIAACRALASARPFSAWIREKDEVTRVKTMQIAVGNGRHYGGGNIVEKDAAIDDGHLDLYSLEVQSVWKLAAMMPAFRAGLHGAWREVRTARCLEFDITTREPRPVNTDGELVTFTPAHFRVHPQAVTVYTP